MPSENISLLVYFMLIISGVMIALVMKDNHQSGKNARSIVDDNNREKDKLVSYTHINNYAIEKEAYLKNKNQVIKFLKEYDEIKEAYIAHSDVLRLLSNYRDCYDSVKRIEISRLEPNDYRQAKEFLEKYARFEISVPIFNKAFINREKMRCSNLFKIGNMYLDDQQQTVVVTDEDHNLVLAGAGSGKTLTITGKVKYLCERKGVAPDEILLIAFARKAAEEMTERVEKMGYGVEAQTFHKLGLGIISAANGRRPDVLDDTDFRFFMEDFFASKILKEPGLIKALIQFFAYYIHLPADMEQFDSLGAAYEYERNSDFETLKSKAIRNTEKRFKNEKRTLQGEFVKSLEEVTIANFLFLHGIEYEYERKYPFSSGDPYRKTYTPDFYLTDYDIYLEHFGINKDGRIPWLSKIEETKYIEGMKWKRECHRDNGTKLIETYSWFNSEGTLISHLEQILRDNGVQQKTIDYEEVYSRIFNDVADRYFREFIQLCTTFITLFKANGYKVDDLEGLEYKSVLYDTEFHRERTRLFKRIIKQILLDYENMLKETGKVDFSDMILTATDIVNNGFRIPKYKYVIVDEFQDTSIARYKMIKAIIKKTGAHLLCVGDDWQSIYRFSGSDLSVFTDFEESFGYSRIMKIEKTYRNSQELIDSASSFIMKNPMQMRKTLNSDKRVSKPLNFYIYQDSPNNAIRAAVDGIIEKYGKTKSIIFLGRTRYEKDVLLKSSLFTTRRNRNKEMLRYRENPDVDIEFMTVHKSKGLEGDNVIILNFNNSLLGFPNKISDDPILELTLSSADSFIYGEERRLLYVAMTRTKNEVFFIVENTRPSEFMRDFQNDSNVSIRNIDFDESVITVNCPRCKTGILLLRKNETTGSEFVGCSNYPHCKYTVNDTSVLTEPKRCQCGGFLLLRKGKYGPFFGCSNYPLCKETKDADGVSESPSSNDVLLFENARSVKEDRPIEGESISRSYYHINEEDVFDMDMEQSNRTKESEKATFIHERKSDFKGFGATATPKEGSSDMFTIAFDEYDVAVLETGPQKKKDYKVSFYLNPEDADKFEFKELCLIGYIKNQLNRITTVGNVKRLTITDIFKALTEMGYVKKTRVHGRTVRVQTELGFSKGIKTEGSVDEEHDYTYLLYPQIVQRAIVAHYVRAIPLSEYGENDISDKMAESHSARVAYNRKMNRPDGAGRGWTKEEDQQLDEEYGMGMEISEIAEIHDRTVGAIRSRLQKHSHS